MKVLRRLPVYATGAGFAALLLAIADARDWSDLTFFLVGLGVALFYTVTILVPWLIHDQVGDKPPNEPQAATIYQFYVHVRNSETGATIKPNGGNGTPALPVTHGPAAVKPTHSRVLTS